MDFWNSLEGNVRIEITSADIAGLLTLVGQTNLKLLDITFVDGLTIRATVQRSHYRRCKELLTRHGDRIKILQKQGAYWKIRNLLCRPLLLIGMLAFLITVFYIPSRIFFVRVEGNMTVPKKLIIEQAESCGILFGASRREVRSEKVKNALLSKIPALRWVGVNTSGCVATIAVREKNPISMDAKPKNNVSSIIASRDGIIKQCTVFQGNALCKTGQAVSAGEILVSGYTDCGISIQATQADAEILAETLRDLTIISPRKYMVRDEIVDTEVRYSLVLGKKLIKLFKDSGISDTTCVKMYTEKILTLPGGFQLPVALISEKITYYDSSVKESTEDNMFEWMKVYAQRYLEEQMVSGKILDTDAILRLQQEAASLHGQYTCLEMIGQVKSEEIIKPNGTND